MTRSNPNVVRMRHFYPPYTSPNLVSEAANFATSSLEALILLPSAALPFPSSSTWNRRFSRRKTVPGAGLAHAASTSGPTQSFRNTTSRPRAACKHGKDMNGDMIFPHVVSADAGDEQAARSRPPTIAEQFASNQRPTFKIGRHGAMLYFACAVPSGRPKCDINTTL